MHNYTLQCFGTIAALTNDKGASLGAYHLATGSYVGLLAVPNCIKSLDLSRMTIGLHLLGSDEPQLTLDHGAFNCTLYTKPATEIAYGVALQNDDTKAEPLQIDTPKPSPGAELLKLVPAGLKKSARYVPEEHAATCGGLTVSKKQIHGPVINGVLESVNYWGAVEPLKGLVKPFDRSNQAVRIDFDGTPIVVHYDTAKLIEKLSKKATFGVGTCEMQFAKKSKQGPVMSACIVAYLDGYNYIITPMSVDNPYITLSLNTTMEQVA